MELEKSLSYPILPSPPPPPPPSQFSSPEKSLINKKQQDNLPSPYIEVSKLCWSQWHYITDGNNNKYLISVYHQVKSILQNGPQCGLVALCMAGQLLSKTLEVNEVFERAKFLNFTKQGEMFSAKNMSELAIDILKCQTEIIVDIEKQQKAIVNHLLKGLPILVPYDADSNHEPCCKKGHTAHWAVLTGFCIVLNDDNKYDLLETCSQDSNVSQLYHWKNNFPFDISEVTSLFIYAKHGKSNYLAIWNFNQLCESNKNLREFSTKHTEKDFLLPKDGIQKELANYALLLK